MIQKSIDFDDLLNQNGRRPRKESNSGVVSTLWEHRKRKGEKGKMIHL